MRETHTYTERGRDTGRGRSRLHAGSLMRDVGLNHPSSGSDPGLKAALNRWATWAAPSSPFFKKETLTCTNDPLWDPASISPASFFTLLQPTSSLSSSHMHLKRLPDKPCCFMPFSSAHAVFSMCYLSFKSLLSKAFLTHMTAPLSECLLYYCNYLFFKKSNLKGL